MRPPATAAATDPRAWAGASLLGSAALWTSAMAPRLLAQLESGPICSGHGLFVLHCPACHAAAGLAVIGLGLAGFAGFRPRSS